MLTSSNVVLVSVAGFPLGAMAPLALAFETEVALRHGAREIDMVLPVGLLKDGDLKSCEATIASVVRAAGPAPVKVILETALLTTSEKTAACQISEAAGARFVKTCTGFGGGEATVADVKLMRNSVGPQVGVKASGGVKSFEKAMALLNAGASRLGTSSGVQIVQGLSASGAY